MSALEGHLHSKCFHVQLQVVSTKYILAHSSHAEGLSPVCNYHVDLQTLPLRELFCITSTYVSTHSSVSFNLYAVSSKKRINTFIITIFQLCTFIQLLVDHIVLIHRLVDILLNLLVHHPINI